MEHTLHTMLQHRNTMLHKKMIENKEVLGAPFLKKEKEK
jgi:hypothetical protein